MQEDLIQINEEAEITEEELIEEKETTIELATVQSVESDGLTLIIDGSAEATSKHYKSNTGVLFKAGDRVKIVKESGSYVVEYPIGAPNSNLMIPSGGTSGQVLTKDGSNDFSVKWASATNPLPTGGTQGQVLVKRSSTNYDVEWSSATASDKLVSGSYYVQLSSTNLNPSSSGAINLGSNLTPFGNLYANGTISLGKSYGSYLGFFGTSPISKQTLYSSETLSTLMQKLKNYGLFS